MAKIDVEINGLFNRIFSKGREYENRNRGVKRLQIPSFTLQHSFEDGFPAMTNKELKFKSIVAELLWFLRGETNIWTLIKSGSNIWNKDAYNWYVKFAKGNYGTEANKFYFENPDGSFRMFLLKEFVEAVKSADSVETLVRDFSMNGYTLGDCGKNYSHQWRRFNDRTDQIVELIRDMKADIMSSRLKVNAWNPSEINDTALPPCHSEFQIIGVPLTFTERVMIYNLGTSYPSVENGTEITEDRLTLMGVPEFGFEMHWNQRSVDTFLGLPFNIASYGLFAKVLEKLTGFPALGIEGTLKCVHFYDNQYDVARELMSRDVNKHSNCTLEISGDFSGGDLDLILKNLTVDNFDLIGYTSDEALNVEMLAPKEL
jgi:thymidylate synthase